MHMWKEGDNSCGLCIIDTDFYVYISTNLLIHTRSFHFLESFVFEF